LAINSAAGTAAYQLAAANTLATPTDLGNVRVGGTFNATLGITNVAPNTGGFTETLGATVTGTTGGVTTASSVVALVQGATSNAISASFNTATAGARNGSATLGFTSNEINSSGLGITALASQTVNFTGTVYQPAVANTLSTPVNLGTVRTGTLVNTTLGVTNTAPAAGIYNETLGAGIGVSSLGLVGLGSVSGLAQNASSNALSVQYTAGPAGAFTGNATVNFTSQGVNGSGLADLALTSQTLSFSATVNALAAYNLVNQSGYTFTPTGPTGATLDFGEITSVSTLSAPFMLFNSAVGPSDSLLGSFNFAGLGGSPFSFVGGTNFDLNAGVGQAFSVQFDPLAFGTFVASFAVNSASHNQSQQDLGLGSYTVTLRGTLGTRGVPEDGATVALLGFAIAGFLGFRRWVTRF